MIPARERRVLVMRDASAEASAYFSFTCDAGVSHGWVVGYLFLFFVCSGNWIPYHTRVKAPEQRGRRQSFMIYLFEAFSWIGPRSTM